MPICIGKLVAYFEPGQTRISDIEVYYIVGIYIALLFVESFVAHPLFMGVCHLSMKLRVACR